MFSKVTTWRQTRISFHSTYKITNKNRSHNTKIGKMCRQFHLKNRINKMNNLFYTNIASSFYPTLHQYSYGLIYIERCLPIEGIQFMPKGMKNTKKNNRWKNTYTNWNKFKRHPLYRRKKSSRKYVKYTRENIPQTKKGNIIIMWSARSLQCKILFLLYWNPFVISFAHIVFLNNNIEQCFDNTKHIFLSSFFFSSIL